MKRLFVAAAAAFSVAAVAVPTVALSGVPASASSAAAQFTADRQALLAASNTFTNAFEAWEQSGGSFAKTSSFVNVYVTAIVTEDHRLLDQNWPAAANSDIDSLVRGDAAVQGAISGLPSQSSSSAPEWFLAYDQDASTATTDANIVRHDLGIPLVTTS